LDRIHAAFTRKLPEICHRALLRHRNLCPEEREEAVAETQAFA
jgi:hypothetical protein